MPRVGGENMSVGDSAKDKGLAIHRIRTKGTCQG